MTMTTPHHPASPCAKCPYRTDSPRKLWHRSEFENLLATEDRQMGAVFACHSHASFPSAEWGMCAGWLLDQKRRDIPSISLRLLLMTNEAAVRALEAVHDGGKKLYRSVEAMCRANGVTRGGRS